MHNYEAKLVDSSRLIADMLVADIGDDRDKFAEMMMLSFRDEYPLSMRAARVIALCVENNTTLIIPHLQRMVDTIDTISVEGVKRSFLKIFAEMPVELNEDMLGILTDRSFNWLVDPKEAIAIRYYAIDILVKVVKLYPEIKIELTESLNSLLDDDSTALHTKGRKVLKYLDKL
jgi:hypothetical protein